MFCQFCGTALEEGALCHCEDAVGARSNSQKPKEASPKMPTIKRREIPTQILLTFITCGIYGIYWRYCILSDIYNLLGEPNTAVTDIILTIVTCGIFALYLYYKIGSKLMQLRIKRGLTPKDDSVVFLLLACISMEIVADCIIQSFLNNEFA